MNSSSFHTVTSNLKATRLSKTMLLALVVSWTLVLSPCVLLLVWMIKYHTGIMKEPPIVYTNNGYAVTAVLYSVFVLSNLAFVIKACFNNKENKTSHVAVTDSLF